MALLIFFLSGSRLLLGHEYWYIFFFCYLKYNKVKFDLNFWSLINITALPNHSSIQWPYSRGFLATLSQFGLTLTAKMTLGLQLLCLGNEILL
jgi:hypothetical protein